MLTKTVGLISQYVEDVFGRRYYTDSDKHANHFVGRVMLSRVNFEDELREMGFEQNPLAGWKRAESDPKKFEATSWRLPEDEMQLHVVLYGAERIDNAEKNCTYVYAHWEPKWDEHPLSHHIGNERNGPEGVRRMKKLLNENGIGHEAIRP